jgi:aspartate kinase
MIIMKFGGTSVKNAQAILNVVSIIKKYQDRKPVIVLSAMAGVTNSLVESLQAAARQQKTKVRKCVERIGSLHLKTVQALFPASGIRDLLVHQVTAEIEKLKILLSAVETIKFESENLMPAILSVGEILSSQILNAALNHEGISTRYLDARKFIITTDPQNGSKPIPKAIRKATLKHIVPFLKKDQILITQGFIAATPDGVPTTLGRNGSDYSASLLGAALDAEEIQIWTDVNGILSADPTIIPYARPLDMMTFDEASELAYFGARVLHPASIQPAMEQGIPVRVLNSNFPGEKGTIIVSDITIAEKPRVKSIAYKENITLVTLQSSSLLFSPEILGEFFQRMGHYGKHVYAVNKSATKLSLTIEKQEDIDKIIKELSFAGQVQVEAAKAVVSIVGQNLKNNPVIIWQIIKMLGEAGIKLDLISQMSSQISFMFIVDEKEIEKTVKLLHKEFIEKKDTKKCRIESQSRG